MRLSLLLLPAVTLGLSACGSDSNLRGSASCNGVLDSVEESVDDAFDADGDGYFDASVPGCQDTYAAEELDCADEDAAVNPGVQEATCNGVDDDCDPATSDAPDEDGDGVTPCDGDCDDHSDLAAPGLEEVACDGLDNDCDPATLDGADEDGDGFTTCDDCDDADPAVNPGALEEDCNGVDDDCNDVTPDGDDFDGDGWLSCFDCDDADPLRYPGADEICEDGIDQDCDGEDSACPAPSWGGIWSTDPVSYTCTGGAVIIDFSSVSILDNNPSLTFSFIGAGAQPGTLSGTLGSGDTFTAQDSIAGACTEEYNLSGSFTSTTTFTATLQANFIDTSGLGFCYDCTNQQFTITGTR